MAALTTVHGIHVPRIDTLKEGYESSVKDGDMFRMRANISAENLDAVFRAALLLLRPPLGLIFEAPINEVRECELRKGPNNRFHRDVFYLDGLSYERTLEIYDRFHELLIHDGFIHYGVLAHETGHEVFVGSYKIVQFFGPLPNPFETIMAEFKIPRTERLVTAWDTFTRAAPGEKSRYCVGDGDIYSMIEDLMRNNGLYHAKTIED
jgi:hypothetical protein